MPIINTTPAVVGSIIKQISGTQGSDQVVKDIQIQGHKLIFTYGDSGRINIINVDGTPLPIDQTDKSVSIDLSGKADVGHTHAISDVTNLQSSLNAKLDDSQLKTAWSSTTSDTNIPSEKLVKATLDGKAPTFTVETTGSGNAVTAVSYANNKITATKGATYLTQHQTIPGITVVDNGTGNAVTDVTAEGHTVTLARGKTFSETGHTHTIANVTNLQTTLDAKYVKPSGGIPKTDLASAVQTSLGKADTALQSHQDISGKVDKLTTSPAGTGFVKVDVNAQGQVTGHSAMVESDIPTLSISKISNLQSALDGKIKRGSYERIQGTSSAKKNLNDYTTAGFYNVKGQYTDNCPLTGDVDYYLMVMPWNTNKWCMQVCVTGNYGTANYQKMWLRSSTNADGTTWTAWSRLANVSDIPTNTNQLTNGSGFITKAVSDLTNYYTKSNTYTKTEVNNLISTHLTLSVVSALPTSNISTTTIYLVPGSDSATSNAYDEYVYTNSTWEKIGTTVTDLTPYAKTAEVNSALGGKVDKLSTSPAGNGFVKVNVNAQGQVTGHSAMAESDIPTLSISKIDGLQSALNGKAATFSVTDSNPTLAWGTKSKVATVAGTAINVTMPANPASGLVTGVSSVNTKTGAVTLGAGDVGAAPAFTVETTGSGNAVTAVSYANNKITATKGATYNNYTHPNPTRSNTTSTASPAHGGTFTAIDSLTSDTNGHVTGVNTKTVTLPAQYSHPNTTRTDTTSTASPAHSGTFTAVDSITTNAQGHVTAVNVKTVTLPASGNTDIAVRQTLQTGNYKLPLLMSYQVNTNTTTNIDNLCYRNNSIYANPSTGIITANGFEGALRGGNAKQFSFGGISSFKVTGNASTDPVALNQTNNGYWRICSITKDQYIANNRSWHVKLRIVCVNTSNTRYTADNHSTSVACNIAIRHDFVVEFNASKTGGNTTVLNDTDTGRGSGIYAIRTLMPKSDSYGPQIELYKWYSNTTTVNDDFKCAGTDCQVYVYVLEDDVGLTWENNANNKPTASSYNSSYYNQTTHNIGQYNYNYYSHKLAANITGSCDGRAGNTWDTILNDRYKYGEAVVGGSLVAIGVDGLAYKLRNTAKEFRLPLEGGRCTGTFAINGNYGALNWSVRGINLNELTNATMQGTAFTVPTWAVGNTIYLRGSIGDNGGFISDGALTNSMAAPSSGYYTYIPIGKVEKINSNAITYMSLFMMRCSAYTLNSNGAVIRIDGKWIHSTWASGAPWSGITGKPTSLNAASGGTTESLVTTGEKYTWNNKSNLAIGTTATTAAAGNHTHDISLASGGTATVNLAYNTAYTLTAGGKSVVFKTPSSVNVVEYATNATNANHANTAELSTDATRMYYNADIISRTLTQLASIFATTTDPSGNTVIIPTVSGYPYRYSFPATGATTLHCPSVIFDITELNMNVWSPLAWAGNGIIVIYAKSSQTTTDRRIGYVLN